VVVVLGGVGVVREAKYKVFAAGGKWSGGGGVGWVGAGGAGFMTSACHGWGLGK